MFFESYIKLLQNPYKISTKFTKNVCKVSPKLIKLEQISKQNTMAHFTGTGCYSLSGRGRGDS